MAQWFEIGISEHKDAIINIWIITEYGQHVDAKYKMHIDWMAA